MLFTVVTITRNNLQGCSKHIDRCDLSQIPSNLAITGIFFDGFA